MGQMVLVIFFRKIGMACTVLVGLFLADCLGRPWQGNYSIIVALHQ